jgi:hypothetical protein
MNDVILLHQPNWRYCRVRAGEKKPYPNGWQNSPLTLEQVDSANIGLILGPKGNGVCAIDFDGTTAWTWFTEQNITSLPVTPTWTSGKVDRCQMAFSVSEQYWDVLETKKIQTLVPTKPGAGDGEGFEFRWAGGQSVLPPSIHPGTKEPYIWLVDATTPVAEIPEQLLYVWLQQIAKKAVVVEDTTAEVKLDDLEQFDINEAESILKILKSRRPVLSYDEWRTVCWGLAHHLGREAAGVLIKMYYPEQKTGEYNGLFRTWNKAKSPKLRSVMFLAGL